MTSTKVKDSVICMSLTASCVKNAVKTYTMSKRYINTMLRASVINILYHRLKIEDKEFTTKKFHEIFYKTSKSKSKNPIIHQYYAYMKACKDAIDKSFLEGFYLYFVDTANNDILESYKFTFRYGERDEESRSQSEGNLLESTCDLLKSLAGLCAHEKIEKDIRIKVELTYYNDVPKDYEPQGFEPIKESDAYLTKLNSMSNCVMLADIFTGFHVLKCRASGGIYKVNDTPPPSVIDLDADPIEDPDQDVQIVNPIEEAPVNIISYPEDENDETLSGLRGSLSRDGSLAVMNDTYFSMHDSEVISIDDESLDCPCQMPNSVETWCPDVDQCTLCKRFCHTPCHGFLDKSFITPPFHCLGCKNDNKSLDHNFTTYAARLRYIVAASYNLSYIPPELKEMHPDIVEAWMKAASEKGTDPKRGLSVLAVDNLFDFSCKLPDQDKMIISFRE